MRKDDVRAVALHWVVTVIREALNTNAPSGLPDEWRGEFVAVVKDTIGQVNSKAVSATRRANAQRSARFVRAHAEHRAGRLNH